MTGIAEGHDKALDGIAAGLREVAAAVRETQGADAWRHKAIRRNLGMARLERERDEARAEVERLGGLLDETEGRARYALDDAGRLADEVMRLRAQTAQDARGGVQERAEGVAEGTGGSEGATEAVRGVRGTLPGGAGLKPGAYDDEVDT